MGKDIIIPDVQIKFLKSSNVGDVKLDFFGEEIDFKNEIIMPLRVRYDTYSSLEQNYFGDNNSIEDNFMDVLSCYNEYALDSIQFNLESILKQSINLEYYELASRLKDILLMIKYAKKTYINSITIGFDE